MNLFEIVVGEPPREDEFLGWLEERGQRIAACAARPFGHRWQVEGEPEEEPHLSCEDCPAGADDLMPDLLDILAYYATLETIGDREVRWGSPLAADAAPFAIPVNISIETITHTGDYGTEYDYEVHITSRGGEGAPTGRGCASAGCSRRAATTIHACGTVHLCEPCLAIVVQLSDDGS
ncbi:hypothetical protein OIE13_06165 [Streptosporangium sp. NBC_01810]|uniref:hypothetical protein n=1 Tax=Streptosporangium sp. NBC_01810 TaxID=2975951 RepID=UPI002DD8C80B|nr:hypothetical protein [Streptosporangium sp. NBC_01810]WSA27459.1 hypothetical protein OIE13_06165 [Streptosporangium sp. NBC_01810]